MSTEDLTKPLEVVSDYITNEEAAAKYEAGKDHAVQAAHELKEAAVLKAQAVKDTAVHRAVEIRRRVDDRVQQARSTCEQRTREEPVKYLLYAFGFGFVFGYLFRR